MGRLQRHGYDKNGNVILEVSEAGGLEQFRRETPAYDGLNRPSEIVETVQDQGGPVIYRQQNAYDDAAHVAFLRDPRGALSRRELDDLDRVIRDVVDDAVSGPLPRQIEVSAGPPVAIERRYEYDADGNRFRTTDPRGNVTVEAYDGLDRLIDRTLPMGVAEHFAYDGMGKAILHTDVRGVQHTTTYDLVGRALIETVGAELRTVLRSYVDTSAGGFWTLQEQDANGHSVVHTYDALHREVSTQDAAGKTGRAYFDSVVKRAALDRKGFRTSFEYDGANRLLAQREFEMDGSLKFSQTTLYDDRARTETLTDRRGISTIRVRDGLSRVVQTTRGSAPDAQSTSTLYDASGNAARDVDANQHVAVRAFDGANRRIAETRGVGTLDETTTRFTLDRNGNRIEQSNPRTGTFVTHDEYDALNRLVRSEAALGNVSLRAYDAGGNVLCEKRPLGMGSLPRGAAATLDLATEQSAACAGAYVTQHEYDELGKLTRTIDSLGGDWRFTYDRVRNLMARRHANGNLTTYEYSARNERVSEHQHLDAHGVVADAGFVPFAEAPVDVDAGRGTLDWAWTYDASGNVATKTDPKHQTVTYAYGVLDRLASETWSGQPQPRELPSLDGVARDYDPNGNLIHVVEHKLTAAGPVTEETRREYDRLDRLKTETRYDGKLVSYSYDSKGNRLGVTDPDGVATTYSFDALDRLATATLPEGTATYAYHLDSLQKTATLPNGLVEQRAYDDASRLLSIATNASRFQYAYDRNGNRTQQIEQRTDPATQQLQAAETTTYGYDALDRLTGVLYPGQRAVLYRLDAVGNRTGEREAALYAGPLDASAFASAANLTRDVTGTFDRADWLRSRSDAVDRSRDVTFSYDLNGNLVRKDTRTNSRELRWDARNTLTSVLENGAELGRYDYCYSGLRVKRSAQGQQVEYVLDDKFVLSEQDGSVGNHPMRRRYHYGSAPLADSEVSGASRFTTWLSVDAQGSVTDATQTDGTVRTARQYDAWGQYRNSTAPRSDEPKLGYTGHQFDPETGLVYARARYYDSGIGLSLSRDPLEAPIGDVPWLHRYLYVRGNPVRYVDAEGMREETIEESRSFAVEQKLAAARQQDYLDRGLVGDLWAWLFGRSDGEANATAIIESNIAAERAAIARANDYGLDPRLAPDSVEQISGHPIGEAITIESHGIDVPDGHGVARLNPSWGPALAQVTPGRFLTETEEGNEQALAKYVKAPEEVIALVTLGLASKAGPRVSETQFGYRIPNSTLPQAKPRINLRGKERGTFAIVGPQINQSDPTSDYDRDSLINGSVYPDNRQMVLRRDKVCQYCQVRQATAADHIVSVYDADAVVGAGMLTPEQAKATVNALENLLGVCMSCNPSKGTQLPGNIPGTWLPPNPTPQAIELMKTLGTWKE